MIGIEESKSLVNWLFETLKGSTDSHKKNTNAPSNRLLQVAIEQASQPSQPVKSSLPMKRVYSTDELESHERHVKLKKQSRSVSDRLGPSQKPIQDRLGPRAQHQEKPHDKYQDKYQDTMQIVQEPIVSPSNIPQKDVTKCSFWPHCARGESCLYIHPSKNCFAGDNCNKKAECIYIHPSDLVVQETPKNTNAVMATIPCKFGLSCLKMDCPFQHPNGFQKPSFPPSEPTTKILCKYAPNCLNPLCPFLHPKDSKETFQEPIVQLTDYSQILCKYDPFCSRPGCLYKHGSSSLQLEPSKKFKENLMDSTTSTMMNSGVPGKFKNKTLSLTRHISERGFAVDESETEKVIPMME